MARPHQAILSRALIFRTALQLIDRTGRFTVPEVAAKLGVSASSLYHHVTGRAEIVEGIRGLISTEFAQPVLTGPWPAAVTTWARSYRDAFAAHPAAIPLLVGQTVSDPGTLAQYDTIAALLETAGLSADDILRAITVLDTLCLGAALDLTAPVVIWAAGEDSALTRALAGATPGVDQSRRAFEFQLELIVGSLVSSAAPLDQYDGAF